MIIMLSELESNYRLGMPVHTLSTTRRQSPDVKSQAGLVLRPAEATIETLSEERRQDR